jgi:hypothetical protein
MNTILPTTLVGSYPQPDWLIDRGKLGKYVPRVRAQELWRVDDEWLDQAQNDATLLAIRDLRLFPRDQDPWVGPATEKESTRRKRRRAQRAEARLHR